MSALARSIVQADMPLQPVDSLTGLKALSNRGLEGVIWARSVPETVVEALAVWPMMNAQAVRICAPVSQIEAASVSVLKEWGGLPPDVQAWLAADIAMLAASMADLLRVSRLLVRLDPVHDDACRKFHKDALRARLICTYKGPGTEYGAVQNSADQPEEVYSVPAGAPLVLKGKHWGEEPAPFLVHRSPPIEEAGLSRLVFVVDEAPDDMREGVIRL